MTKSFFKVSCNNLISFLILLIILQYFISGCGKISSHHSDNKYLTVATFNVSWLGDGKNDQQVRKEKDYKRIAEIITETGADIIGLQEIENSKALLKVAKYLEGYRFEVGKDGHNQNLAVLYKGNIKLKIIGEYTSLEIERGKNRPGFLLEARKGNFDFIMMIVHLKATSHFDDTEQKKIQSIETRRNQAEVLAHWADSTLKKSKEKDLLIIGDFNDSPLRKNNNTLLSLYKNKHLIFLTEELENCMYKSAYSIDHIIVSRSARNRYIENSRFMLNIFSLLPEKDEAGLSDHCPVIVKFDCIPADND
ncbi:MAG: endonuclease [Ignavibacteria bacterium]|nr:endonuclease [Ignavibacteria bacterium]